MRKQPVVALRRRTCSAPGMARLGRRRLALVRSLRRPCLRIVFSCFHAATAAQAAQHSPYRVFTSHHAANMARVPRLGLESSTHARPMSCLKPLPHAETALKHSIPWFCPLAQNLAFAQHHNLQRCTAEIPLRSSEHPLISMTIQLYFAPFCPLAQKVTHSKYWGVYKPLLHC